MENQCPRCTSNVIKRNGYTRHGKQNYRCLDCGRQFSSDLEEISINEHDGAELIGVTMETLIG